MRMFLMTAAVVLVLVQAAAAQPGRACEYGMNICESYAAADLVFVGTVTRVVPESFSLKQYYAGYDQTAYVGVEKVYKGTRRARVVLRQRRHAEKFVPHSRYLFYANYDRRAKIWEVRPCGNTRLALYAQDDLRYLDALPASATQTRVSGDVVHFVEPDEEQASSRLPGVRVRLRPAGAAPMRRRPTPTGSTSLTASRRAATASKSSRPTASPSTRCCTRAAMRSSVHASWSSI